MLWYYLEEEKQVGPISEEDFELLVMGGAIQAGTLVWHEKLTGWVAYGTLKNSAQQQVAVDVREALPEQSVDAQSSPTPQESEDFDIPWSLTEEAMPAPSPESLPQKVHSPEMAPVPALDNLDQRAGSPASPVAQAQAEGETGQTAVPVQTQAYAGFWMRAAAMTIDNIILLGAIAVLWGLSAVLVDNMDILIILQLLIVITAGIGYHTGFVGLLGATPGKKILGLKIVRPGGDVLTYPRACARALAYLPSFIMAGLGFLMVTVDREKRALHDRICGTRVIKSRG